MQGGLKSVPPGWAGGTERLNRVRWTLEVQLAYHIAGESLAGVSELECTAQNKAFIYRNELANENPQEGYSTE